MTDIREELSLQTVGRFGSVLGGLQFLAGEAFRLRKAVEGIHQQIELVGAPAGG